MTAPLSENGQPQFGGPRTLVWSSALFCVVFVVLALSAPSDFINGDATAYAMQIRDANFSERTTHLGYFLLAYPVSLLPLELSHVLNLLNCAFGAGTVLLVGLIGKHVARSERVGVLSGLVAAFNAVVVGNALHAEVYMAQIFFVLAAACFWLWKRAALAGAAAALAFLVTSSSALAAPFFLITRPRLGELARMAAVAIVIAAAALIPVLDNYLFGARGLVAAIGHGVNHKLAVLKTGQDVFYGFFVFIPFLIAGAIACWRQQALRRFVLAALAVWVAVFLFGEKFLDVPVQLPTYMLFAVVAGIGLDAALAGNRTPVLIGGAGALALLGVVLLVKPFVPAAYADHLPDSVTLGLYGMAILLTAVGFALSASKRVAIAVIALAVLSNAVLIVRKEAASRENLTAIANLAAEIRQTPNAIVVAKWNEMVRVDWLLYKQPYDAKSFDVDELGGLYPSEKRMQAFRETLPNTQAVFLLSPQPALERLLAESGFRRERGEIYRRK